MDKEKNRGKGPRETEKEQQQEAGGRYSPSFRELVWWHLAN